MKHGIRGLDHPVIAARSLDAAGTTYERLGFTVPPPGRHLEWGTGNLCLMFARTYLEIRGIVDPAKYLHGVDTYLAAHGEGLMGVALATDDASASHDALLASGLRPEPVRTLTRSLALPGEILRPRFRLCALGAAEEIVGLTSVVLLEHLTPDVIRHDPGWLDHPNGAERLVSMTAVVPDIAVAVAAHRRLFGAGSVRARDTGFVVEAGQGTALDFLTEDAARARYPRTAGGTGRGIPRLIATTLGVSDLARAAAALASAAVPHDARPDGALVVGPDHACGMALEFVAA